MLRTGMRLRLKAEEKHHQSSARCGDGSCEANQQLNLLAAGTEGYGTLFPPKGTTELLADADAQTRRLPGMVGTT